MKKIGKVFAQTVSAKLPTGFNAVYYFHAFGIVHPGNAHRG